MKTIIIGSSGVIGYNLFLYLKKKQKNVIGTYNYTQKIGLKKFNIIKDKINNKIKIFKDDKVIILTAISNPSKVFADSKTSNKINILCTIKLIDDLKKIGCKIIFMSSIEVFDGTKGNYNENSKPNPLNLYGKQKLFVENYLKNNSKNYCILRTSFIVGSDPNQRCPVKLTYDTLLEPNAKMAKDNFFAITSINDLSKVIYKVLFNKKFKNLQICHISSKEKVSRTKLAKLVIKNSKKGFKMKFKKTLFKFINYSEPRGRKNNLISINKEINKYKYENAKSVIKKKVRIIEKLNEANYSK